MTILPFPGADWNDDERAEIRGLEKACDAVDEWLLECSNTDAGDPWCIVYDQRRRTVIVHFARFDGQYVVVWPREQRSKKTSIMAVAIDIALEGLKLHRRRAS